jgi:hypothetical protein
VDVRMRHEALLIRVKWETFAAVPVEAGCGGADGSYKLLRVEDELGRGHSGPMNGDTPGNKGPMSGVVWRAGRE